MSDGIYVPMSERSLRDLDQLVSITELPEERIIEMAFTNLLACLRQYVNDNFPTEPNFDPAGVSSVSPSNPTAGFGGEASEPLGAI